MQEVLTEQYNDQLRELREAGLSESSPEFRDAVRELRDEERAPLGSVQVTINQSWVNVSGKMFFSHLGFSAGERNQMCVMFLEKQTAHKL